MYLHKFGLFCKSYKGDYNRILLLLESINKFNIDNIPIYISVPKADFDEFYELVEKFRFTLLCDESISENMAIESFNGFSIGYINQQIIKFEFSFTNLCEYYFSIDSDVIFIKDFSEKDFFFEKDTPFTIIDEDKDTGVDPIYEKNYGHLRRKDIAKIFEYFNLPKSKFFTCHGMAIISAKVIKSFYDNNVFPFKRNFIYFLKISPFEYSWYNAWILKNEDIKFVKKEPLVKFYHMYHLYIFDRVKGINLNDLGRSYIGICLNSNWADKVDVYDFNKTTCRLQVLKFLLKLMTVRI